MIVSNYQTILISSGKGGVGKTTFAINLALLLNKLNIKIGLLDADVCGPSISSIFKYKNKKKVIIDNNKYILPLIKDNLQIMSVGYLYSKYDMLLYRGPMLTKILLETINITYWKNIKYLIIDLPPGFYDIHLTIFNRFVNLFTIIITTNSILSRLETIKTISMFNNKYINIPILGIVENNISTDKLNNNFIYNIKKLCINEKIKYLGYLPYNKSINFLFNKKDSILLDVKNNNTIFNLLNILKDIFNTINTYKNINYKSNINIIKKLNNIINL